MSDKRESNSLTPEEAKAMFKEMRRRTFFLKIMYPFTSRTFDRIIKSKKNPDGTQQTEFMLTEDDEKELEDAGRADSIMASAVLFIFIYFIGSLLARFVFPLF